MDKYIKEINKHWKLYKSLPFIKEIYLCNSITFNALKRESDIDLFIVVEKWHMWRARFFSAILFKLNWLKRSMTNKRQKFCLSFYISEDNQNLYPIMINKTDIYLSYRLAHLVPLYKTKIENKHKNDSKCSDDHNIYQDNKRLNFLMPNHPQEHCINIWNNLFTWKSKIKKRLEFWFWWIFWKVIEVIIKVIWLPILLYKIKKLWTKWKQIIISDKMLKFHDDIRKQIQLIYHIAKKN
jgi:predicted nucleotidyltransferase